MNKEHYRNALREAGFNPDQLICDMTHDECMSLRQFMNELVMCPECGRTKPAQEKPNDCVTCANNWEEEYKMDW